MRQAISPRFAISTFEISGYAEKCRLAFASRLLGTAATESLLIIAVAILFRIKNALVSEFLCNRICVSLTIIGLLDYRVSRDMIAAVPISALQFTRDKDPYYREISYLGFILLSKLLSDRYL
jgi:hypothetical protein